MGIPLSAAQEEIVGAVREILRDWTDVSVAWSGQFWTICGRYRGITHAGSRIDGIELAASLKSIAEVFDPLVHPDAESGGAFDAPLDGDDTFVEPVAETDLPAALCINYAGASIAHTASATPQYASFNPGLWTTLDEAQGALRARVQQEHAARTRIRQLVLETMASLAMIERTPEQEAELAQNIARVGALGRNDAMSAEKLTAVAALTSLAEAQAYADTVTEGWAE